MYSATSCCMLPLSVAKTILFGYIGCVIKTNPFQNIFMSMLPLGRSSSDSFWAKMTMGIARFFQFPKLGGNSETAKLIWLVRLRWTAITLFFLMAGPGYIFGYLDRQTLVIFIGVIGFLFLFNLLTHLIFVEPKRNVGPLFICFQLALDLVVLSSLLLISGGFGNPFVGLFLLNAALGGVLIRGKHSLPFVVLCHALLIALQINYIDAHRPDLDKSIFPIIFVSHILVFSVWLVMRSLGSYLENHFESLVQSRVLFEKQDRLRAIGALAAGFSHEFASPLNAAKLRLDRLERNLDELKISANVLENLSEAKLSISECENVVHSMNSSQFDVRDYALKFVRMEEFLKDVIESWKEEHSQAKVVLAVNQKDKTKIPPVNFAQVILNLLDNAYEAASKEAIQISFSKVNDEYAFVVEDAGPGFSDNVLKLQGEPFVTTKENGTGLGLYVSEIFAQSLGGRLVLENKTVKGAKVTIFWPEPIASVETEGTAE
jgi:two-component system, sensor histidine kinase RegB